MNDINRLFDLWCNRVTDEKLLSELESIKGDSEGILDRFYKDLEFGTGGLRGVIGAGTNRMNIYTVGRATQGFANYIKKAAGSNPSVAIAYDSRINSDVFSKTAAGVFAANGIKVFIYPELAPTPMLSFAVRNLKCDAGIVITASHNPSKYNGYKAYGPDGCQLNLEASEAVIEEIGNIDIFDGVKRMDFDAGIADGIIEIIGDEVYQEYYKCVMAQSVNPDVFAKAKLNVVYTPLNGAGNKPVRTVLSKMGIVDLTVVPQQENPDGNFPTAPYPNPEIRQAFECALKLAEKVKPDLLLATDPDSDRMGIAVRNGDDYVLMSGNEVGAMMLDYLLSQRMQKGTLPHNPIAVKTIVSSAICDKIAEKYGCEMVSLLTGFKFIGEKIGQLEKVGEENRYIMGFEESYGYLAGTYVRDKDAVFASMMVCEMASYYKLQGKSLLDVMNGLYKEYGVYHHEQLNIAFEGASGMEKMKSIMSNLCENAPKTINNIKIVKVSNYIKSIECDIDSGKTSAITLPKSDVLSFVLENGSQVIIRPSGTEPKIKVYLTTQGETSEEAESLSNAIGEDVKKSFGF